MAEKKETYIGNSKLKNSPEKFLKVVLGEQVVKTKDIADKAVTLNKIADDVKQYVAEQVGVETEGRNEEVERLEGLIDLERSDRGAEETSIWAEVNARAVIIELSRYKSATSVLPLNGNYVYNGRPVHAVYLETEVGQDTLRIIVFCIQHTEREGLEDHRIIYYSKSGNDYVFTGEFNTNDAETKLEKDIKQAIGGYIADGIRPGLMSEADKNNLDTAVSDLSVVKGKISSAASPSNQLADKNFVNSSISTATANFKGTNTIAVDETAFLQWANALSGKDLNDYVFWQTKDSSGNTLYKRYKYTENNSWLFEYSLNNSSFTADQWAAINSGLTSNDKTLVSQASSDATIAKDKSIEALGNSAQAVEDSSDAIHKVNNLEGAWTGTSPILEFSTTTEYGTGANQVRYCYHEGLLYRATAIHTGEWNAEHFEAINMIDLLETYENMVVGDKTVNEFDAEKEYTAGDPVIYNNEFYIFKRGHTGEWDEIDVDKTSFIEWLKNLSDTIETYVGNGKEQVVVSCSTEAQGVSMAGLTLMVYLNGSTTEAEEYTTDSHGMATFRIPVGYTYRIVYPSVAGVVTPAPETHTASVGQRSVEVRYDVPPAPQVEVLAVNFQKWGENTGGYAPYQGQARITIGGTATTYTADEDGVITVSIPLGTAYTLDIIKPEGLHIMGGSYHKSLVAEQSSRVEVVRLSEYLSGILLTDEEGNDYSFDQFQSLVEQGVLAKGDAKYIHLCTDALLSNAVVEGTDSTCYVSIYEIGKRKYHDTDGNFANLRWCDNSIQFSSIPNNVYQYDGKYRTAQIIAEGIERGFPTPAATRLSGMSYTFTNSSATVISGFLASRGQWDALWNNRTYIDEMLDYVFDGAEHLTLSSFTANKWASDQFGGGAWFLAATWSTNTKNGQSMAVPFYA